MCVCVCVLSERGSVVHQSEAIKSHRNYPANVPDAIRPCMPACSLAHKRHRHALQLASHYTVRWKKFKNKKPALARPAVCPEAEEDLAISNFSFQYQIERPISIATATSSPNHTHPYSEVKSIVGLGFFPSSLPLSPSASDDGIPSLLTTLSFAEPPCFRVLATRGVPFWK